MSSLFAGKLHHPLSVLNFSQLICKVNITTANLAALTKITLTHQYPYV